MTKKKNKQKNLNDLSNSGSENSSKRTPCYFYKQGNCARGDSCPFLHEGANSAQSQAKHSKYSNALNVVDNSDFSLSDFDRQEFQEIVSRPPVYFFSSFAVTKGGHRGIINDRDISPEELRYLAYESKEMGEYDTYEAIAEIARQDMLNLFEFINNNMDKAERYIEIARQRSDSEIKNFLPPEEVHDDNATGLLAIRLLQGNTSVFNELKKRIQEKKTGDGFGTRSINTATFGQSAPQTASSFGNAQQSWQPRLSQATQFGARLGGTAPVSSDFGSSPVPPPTTNNVATGFGSPSLGSFLQQPPTSAQTSALGARPTSKENPPFTIPPPPTTNPSSSIFGSSSFGSSFQPQPAAQPAAFGASLSGTSEFGRLASNNTSNGNTSASTSLSPFTSLGPSAQQPTISSFGSFDSTKSIPPPPLANNSAPVFGSSFFGSHPAPAFGSSTFGSAPASAAAIKPVFGQTGLSAFANNASPFGSVASSQQQASQSTARPEDKATANQSKPFAAFSMGSGSAFSAFAKMASSTASPFGAFAEQQKSGPTPFTAISQLDENNSMPFAPFTIQQNNDKAAPSTIEATSLQRNDGTVSMFAQQFQQQTHVPTQQPQSLSPQQQDDLDMDGRQMGRADAASVPTMSPTAGATQGKMVTGCYYTTQAMRRFPISSQETENNYFPGLPPRPRSKMEQMYAYFLQHSRQALKPDMTNPNTGYVAFLQSAGDTYLPDIGDLTLDEKAAFEAKTYELGKVPEIAPPLLYM
ncbi:uncharacterized protein V1513DRAFT_436419 [Lipomyces chichibuensis]|uniref:uncharacterized protein n=1 Tax=Lipomyces chichibuensis TaxID=1546026 RepID=UPI0033442A91